MLCDRVFKQPANWSGEATIQGAGLFANAKIEVDAVAYGSLGARARGSHMPSRPLAWQLQPSRLPQAFDYILTEMFFSRT
jgi:hypothetical protein